MSRGDFGANVSYQQTPGARDGDSEYLRLSNAISNNIQTMTKYVAAIQRMVQQIGTSRDVPELFDDLQAKQRDTSKLAKETSDYLKHLGFLDGGSPQEQRQRRIQQDKLRDNFSNVLNNFQKAQRLAAEKEKASVQRARAASVDHHEDREQAQVFQQERGPQIQMQTEAELSLEEIKEREEAIRKLEHDILDVNDIFKELALMVHEHGDVIDSIEANVDSASSHVEQGNVQLEKARDYQKASRRKMCCLLVILLLVAGIIGLIVWLTTRK
eukprot:Seg1018.16 transcript_id=Seg1018.16/GoldUCD/mRNA.D3Y31 product=Syntaxin-7 protein_id=Seg1018.16/GoldUCD/D3Y31